jgi:[ribosomal protein S18]-alanine N-acetyltransferase
MIVREYIPSDHEACMSLFKGNMPLYFDPSEEELFEVWLKARDEGRLRYAGNAHEHFFVVEGEHGIVACGGFYISKSEKKASLAWGMVKRELHKRSIGKNFLEYRLNLIKDLYPGHEVIMITSQHTYGFFEKYGFKTLSTTKDAFGPGLDRYDMVLQA